MLKSLPLASPLRTRVESGILSAPGRERHIVGGIRASAHDGAEQPCQVSGQSAIVQSGGQPGPARPPAASIQPGTRQCACYPIPPIPLCICLPGAACCQLCRRRSRSASSQHAICTRAAHRTSSPPACAAFQPGACPVSGPQSASVSSLTWRVLSHLWACGLTWHQARTGSGRRPAPWYRRLPCVLHLGAAFTCPDLGSVRAAEARVQPAHCGRRPSGASQARTCRGVLAASMLTCGGLHQLTRSAAAWRRPALPEWRPHAP